MQGAAHSWGSRSDATRWPGAGTRADRGATCESIVQDGGARGALPMSAPSSLDERCPTDRTWQQDRGCSFVGKGDRDFPRYVAEVAGIRSRGFSLTRAMTLLGLERLRRGLHQQKVAWSSAHLSHSTVDTRRRRVVMFSPLLKRPALPRRPTEGASLHVCTSRDPHRAWPRPAGADTEVEDARTAREAQGIRPQNRGVRGRDDRGGAVRHHGVGTAVQDPPGTQKGSPCARVPPAT